MATNGGDQVALIDTKTNFVGPPIPVGDEPRAVAITPDGGTAYVTNQTSGDVSVIDIQSSEVVGARSWSAPKPKGIAVTPDGSRAYVANSGAASVSVIDTRSNAGGGASDRGRERTDGDSDHSRRQPGLRHQCQLGQRLGDRHPDEPGRRVARSSSGANLRRSRSPPTAAGPTSQSQVRNSVSAIDTQTNQVAGSPIVVGTAPEAIAITPDQPPIAAFTNSSARPGVATSFDASASGDPDGLVARFEWDFGDGADDNRRRPHADTHLQEPRHPPGDPDRDRQRGLLNLAQVHRADRLLQGIGIGKADAAGVGRLPRGSHRMPEASQAQRLQVQAHGGDEEAQGKGNDRCRRRQVSKPGARRSSR